MPIDTAIGQSLAKPSALRLGWEYMKFGMPGSEGRAPCRRSRDPGVGGPKVRNQCAVRMSVALCRSMNADIFGAYDGGSLHSGHGCAGADDDKCRHIASSETLFNYLRETLNFTFEPIGTNYSLIPQPGIIFFQNISGFRAGVGDHIDYWNGRTYFNAVSGTGGPSGNLNLFRRASRVWYCRL